MTWQRTVSSAAETGALGEALGTAIEPGTVLGLTGDLGAGKTLFVQGMARGLGVPAGVRVVSPTFTLVNEYRGGRCTVHHADLYRLEQESELDHVGLFDAMGGDAIVAVEWSDRFKVLPRDHLLIAFEVVDEQSRILVASASGRKSERVLAAWKAAAP